jgi:hypothetical protein
MYLPFKNLANARTVATPRKLSGLVPSPDLLIQDALIIIASVPECRGDAKTA